MRDNHYSSIESFKIMYTEKEQAILDDPSASFWLKAKIKEVKDRDPVDVLNDMQLLEVVVKAKIMSEHNVDY